ncbi:MAG TPA: 50S ribosomal protein L16 [Acidobacteriota bacterium]|nr:50S ribosomal protein L16 [Acidobacteriota bacterium]
MATIRKFVAYRRLERPYTRKSKYREKSYIRGSPHNKITRYNGGNLKGTFEYSVKLHAKATLQIRDCALESARLIVNRHCEKKIGLENFYLALKPFPHHHLRENPLATGAGADRLSTGMAFSFGKVIGLAARIFKGDDVIEVRVNKDRLEIAKEIIHLAASKLPCKTYITIEPVKKN